MLYCDGTSKYPSTEGTEGDHFLIPSSELELGETASEKFASRKTGAIFE
jgi:hypothetical protein